LDSASSKPSIPFPGVYGIYAVEPILLKSGIIGITPIVLANVEKSFPLRAHAWRHCEAKLRRYQVFISIGFVNPSCHTSRPRIRRLFPSTLPLLSQADRDAKLLRESEAIVDMQTCWLQGLPNERDLAKKLSP
jgi:hypothetical protein